MVDSPSNHQFALGLRSDETPTNVRSDEKAKLRKKFFQSKAVLEIDSAYRKRHSVQLRITRADPLSSPRSNTVYNMSNNFKSRGERISSKDLEMNSSQKNQINQLASIDSFLQGVMHGKMRTCKLSPTNSSPVNNSIQRFRSASPGWGK